MYIETKSGVIFTEAPKGKNYLYYTFHKEKIKIDVTLFRSTSRNAYQIRNIRIVFETLEDVGLYISEVMGESTLPQPMTRTSTIFHGISFIDGDEWFLVGCMPFDLGSESRTLGYFKDKNLADEYLDILRKNYPLGMDL